METQNLSQPKTVVIIPAYEPPRAFVDYARALLAQEIARLIVVDDGSGESYADIFNELESMERCTVLSYPQNHGKGYALKHAFAYCKTHFDESYVFVTADCDGQHLVKDVQRVAEEAANTPNDLVLGSRDFSLEHVPPRSRAGNVTTRKLYKFFYGLKLQDTQTGLRGFSYSLLGELLKIKGNRFEYEMSMLIVLHNKHYTIREIPIETVYADPPQDGEKVSHYRTFRDGSRVAVVLFKNAFWYLLSALGSGVIEISVFFALTTLALHHFSASAALTIALPTVTARVLSSIFNYFFNFKIVFHGKQKRSVFRYYTLWTVQLGASYGIACLLTAWITGYGLSVTLTAALITLFKYLCDLFISIVSYGVQRAWVFADPKDKRLHFYGFFLRFCRFFFNIFVRKYKCELQTPEKPTVYLCRHLHTHGPIKVYQSLNFDVHSYVLKNFFTFKSCLKQFGGYTFTVKHKKKGLGLVFAKIGAFFASLVVAPLVRSARAIPVYRGGNDSIKTLRKSMEYLDKGESIMIYPDVDYTASADKASEIYTGFLFLDKLYYNKHKEHLDFVVVRLDTANKAIIESGRARFAENGDFRKDMPRVAAELHDLLMHQAE
ncbi:MAG: bifunctional glycosyltransferase family 2/GtrA family protein [Clostridia bacterium]|nr:bifunctional glycosyltransferase family 2/GtrA family protein [Clostridia bacterium]